MKPYFFLLAVLLITNTFLRVWQITVGIPAPLVVSYLADMVCFGLCLWCSWGLSFDKKPLTRPQARLIYYATMAAGIVSVLLRLYGHEVGVPAVGGRNIVDVGMWALSYVLFAIPAVIYDTWLKTGQKPGQGPDQADQG